MLLLNLKFIKCSNYNNLKKFFKGKYDFSSKTIWSVFIKLNWLWKTFCLFFVWNLGDYTSLPVHLIYVYLHSFLFWSFHLILFSFHVIYQMNSNYVSIWFAFISFANFIYSILNNFLNRLFLNKAPI